MNSGVSTGIRTPVPTVKGWCPRPLDDGDRNLPDYFGHSSISGGKRDRTADLLHAMQALSQLSYTPLRRSEIIAQLLPGCKSPNENFMKEISFTAYLPLACALTEMSGEAIHHRFPAKQFHHRIDGRCLQLPGQQQAQRHRQLRHLQLVGCQRFLQKR